MPPRYLAHLEPDFPHWLNLAVALLKRAQQDDRFVVLPTDLTIPDLVQRLDEACVEDGDLIEEPGPDDQSLRITYEQEGTEDDRFLMVGSGRFLLEVSLTADQRPRWIRLAVFCEEEEIAPYKFLPWRGETEAMMAHLWSGAPMRVVELA